MVACESLPNSCFGGNAAFTFCLALKEAWSCDAHHFQAPHGITIYTLNPCLNWYGLPGRSPKIAWSPPTGTPLPSTAPCIECRFWTAARFPCPEFSCSAPAVAESIQEMRHRCEGGTRFNQQHTDGGTAITRLRQQHQRRAHSARAQQQAPRSARVRGRGARAQMQGPPRERQHSSRPIPQDQSPL